MNPLLLAALLAIPGADAVPAPAPVPDATQAPKTAAPATSVAPPELRLPRGGFDAGSLAAPAVLLAGLGAAALVLRRRRRAPGRHVQVLETTSLGPKRSLVLAQLGDELLLLGSSEAGIELLRTRPAAGAPPLAAAPPPLPAIQSREPREPPAALRGLVARLRQARPRPTKAPEFDALLAESAEDQELRLKLARGQRGSVR